MSNIGVLEKLKDKRVAVLGLGITGVHLVKFLVSNGIKPTVCDIKEEKELDLLSMQLQDLDIEFKLGSGYLDDLDKFEVVFLSPGIDPAKEEITLARGMGVQFSSEIELLFELSKAPVIGITGSSGKTTTTSLTGAILQHAYSLRGAKAYIGGNIGTPLIDKVFQFTKDDVVLLELSSFQLKYLKKSAHIGAILNITPNHLDVHPDMEDYIESKAKLINYQGPEDYCILNMDNHITADLGTHLASNKIFFSITKEVQNGAYLEGDKLILSKNGEKEVVCSSQDILIPGMHNVENVLASIAISYVAGVDKAIMFEEIKKFKGVKHRLETVAEIDGVKYINDSISTTPTRAMAGIKAIDAPIIQIAGGYDKKLPFDDMADLAVEKVKAFVLLGSTATDIKSALLKASEAKGVNNIRIYSAASLEEAVHIAQSISEPGDVVLLSPACASYDMFRNFEERGNTFRDIVSGL